MGIRWHCSEPFYEGIRTISSSVCRHLANGKVSAVQSPSDMSWKIDCFPVIRLYFTEHLNEKKKILLGCLD